ncbi:glycosyltransferase [Fusobacterium ulcerans]|uniref:Glycosyl transferase family 1 domain-containing protein n=1 Tax=Fusobacterium ulcerans 12-1B TaxID=457404 RepID=S2LGJ7_9FUSO|nr:glycosyltransferase [Fusobacterium ulcerans]EPC09181.1 hypothetical protein HMPREF0402_04095 [Fusobacterium ulcerans 12-1B]
MKKIIYIIITPRLSSLGGAELYAIRRAEYLKEKKIEVILIAQEVNSKALKLGKIRVLEIEELISDSIFSRKTQLEKINRYIENNFNDFDEVYIETNFLRHVFLGEKIAKKYFGRHLFYMLVEMELYKTKYIELLRFKLDRNEMIGVNNRTLDISLGKYWNNKYEENYVNVGFSKKEIEEDHNFDKKYIKNKNFRILTISRLEKTYVENLIKDVIKLSTKYSNVNFELTIIGDSKNKIIRKKLENKYKTQKNFIINFLGYIYPLKKNYFYESDIFVGMGTAAISGIAMGCATICIDPRNNKASGYFGVDTNNCAYSKNDKTYEIFELIEKIILNPNLKNIIEKEGEKIFIKEYELIQTMKKLDNYMFFNNFKKKYWEKNIIIFKEEIRYFTWKIKVFNFVLLIKNKIFKKNFLNM